MASYFLRLRNISFLVDKSLLRVLMRLDRRWVFSGVCVSPVICACLPFWAWLSPCCRCRFRFWFWLCRRCRFRLWPCRCLSALASGIDPCFSARIWEYRCCCRFPSRFFGPWGCPWSLNLSSSSSSSRRRSGCGAAAAALAWLLLR